ncbi:hypothetical protein HDU97_010063 [Phlyctochytrium planicorne]|nr:hypothetical protein HDU97_010063 [Phlyctochytrium planicorne]
MQADDHARVEAEIRALTSIYEQRETEENWNQFDDALGKLKQVVRTHGHNTWFTPSCVRRMKGAIAVSLASDRTKLARTGLTLVDTLAEELRERLESCLDVVVTPVMKLCGKANKVYVSCASATMKGLVEHLQLPSVLPYLQEYTNSQTKTSRIAAAEVFVKSLEVSPSLRLHSYAELIEASIRAYAVDPTPEVRGFARQAFETYKDVFSHRVDKFTMELDEVTVKNLKIPKVDTSKRISIKQKVIALRDPSAKAGSVEEHSDVILYLPTGPAPSTAPALAAEAKNSLDIKPQGTQLGRRLFDRPARIHNEATYSTTSTNSIRESIWAAQRVLKETTASALEHQEKTMPLKNRAQRVPSAVPTSESQPGSRAISPPARAKTVSEGVPSKAAEKREFPGKDLKPRRPTERAVPTKTLELPEQSSTSEASIDLNDFALKLKNHDWAIRFQAIEALKGCALRLSDQNDNKHKLSKISDMLVNAINDNHSKVAISAANGLRSLMLAPHASPELLVFAAPRLAAALNQRLKVNFTGKMLVEDMKERYGTEASCNALCQGLQNSEFAKNPRVRGGCCQLLAEFSEKDWAEIGKVPRNLPSRLLAANSDIDILAKQSVKAVFAAVHAAFPELISSIWITLKPSDRKTVNGIFGSSSSSLDRFVMETSRKAAQPRGSVEIRSPSPGSTTVNSPSLSPKSLSTSRNRKPPTPKSAMSTESHHSYSRQDRQDRDSISSAERLFASSSNSDQAMQRSASKASSISGLQTLTVNVSTSNHKLSAAYEDSDTDWVTDNEVLRSPNGSDNEFTLGDNRNDETEPQAMPRSYSALESHLSFDSHIEPPKDIKERFGHEVDENANTLKKVEEFLSMVENPGVNMFSVQSNGVAPSAEAVDAVDVLNSPNGRREDRSFSISEVTPKFASGDLLPSDPPAEMSPLEKLGLAVNSILGSESANSMKDSLKAIRDLLASDSSSAIMEAIPTFLPSILTRSWENIAVEEDDQLEIDYELDTFLDCIYQHASTEVILATFSTLDHTTVFESRPTFELLERVLRKFQWGQNDDEILPLVDCVAKGLDSANTAGRKSAFDCAVHVLRKRPALEDYLFNSLEQSKGKSRVAIIKGMVKRKLEQI